MTDSLPYDARLSATEAQMRRALGLKDPPRVGGEIAPQPASLRASRRRFVRDGEVPVSVIHRNQDDGPGANKLDAVRQALEEQVAARKHFEHLLKEAQTTIHALRTKLAHEQIAREEATQRLDREKQVAEQALQRVQEDLAVERDHRQQAEQERDEAIAVRQEAGERHRAVEATQDAHAAARSAHKLADMKMDTKVDGIRKGCETVQPTIRKPGKAMPANKTGRDKPKQRLAKCAQSRQAFVEWWKPGWRDRFR